MEDRVVWNSTYTCLLINTEDHLVLIDTGGPVKPKLNFQNMGKRCS
jgi:hypothetical protein